MSETKNAVLAAYNDANHQKRLRRAEKRLGQKTLKVLGLPKDTEYELGFMSEVGPGAKATAVVIATHHGEVQLPENGRPWVYI